MRNRFPGHYRPSEEEFRRIWAECLFVPDANILLHLFRYGAKTRAQVIETLERLQPRVWVPYRVGFEFHRRWRDVDQTNRDAYDRLVEELRRQGRSLSGLFDQYTRHQMIDVKQEQKSISDFVEGLCGRLLTYKSEHPAFEDAEKVFFEISDLIGDAVGASPPPEEVSDLIKEGERRYDKLVPPGYKDSGKDSPDKFGDFFLWKEVLNKSKESEKPIVMITDDVKEDWWHEFRGAKIGPRPELVEEMFAFSGQRFYLYTLSQFLDYSSGFLKRAFDTAALEEIKSDEEQRREISRRRYYRPSYRPPQTEFNRHLRAQMRALRTRLAELDERISASEPVLSPEALERVRELVDDREFLASRLRDVHRSLRDIEEERFLTGDISRDPRIDIIREAARRENIHRHELTEDEMLSSVLAKRSRPEEKD